jgi:hypothetical protein
MSGLVDAAEESLTAAKQKIIRLCGGTPANPLPVAPIIQVDAPKIVLVKKPYQAKGSRIRVNLGVTNFFSGTGTLSCSSPADIRLFDLSGTALALPLTVTAADLNSGKILNIEGAAPSAGMNTTTLTLSLTPGGEPVINSPANDGLTCVEVHLDLCGYKAVPGGADPAPLPEGPKQKPGRNLHLQDKRNYAGRAMIIVKQAVPKSYPGQVVLSAIGGRVCTYPYAEEVPTSPSHRQQDPFSTPNAAIPAGGLKLWVEGSDYSRAVLDTGFTLGISDLPRQEGDRVQITVVRSVLDVYQSRRDPKKDPDLVDQGKQMKPGRFLHKQDAGNHHGRAKVRIRKVDPPDWDGTLELLVCNASDGSTANVGMRLMSAETGGAAQANPYKVHHSSAFAAAGDVEWAEGATASGALSDIQLRLRVTDAEGAADRSNFTVCEFSTLLADIPSTPAVTPRAGNSPVNRHQWKIADPAAASKDFDEDYAVNKPLVLIENSVKSTDQVKLSVKVKPAGVPVRWAVIRDRRPKPNGDNKDIINLSDNNEAPTLASNAEKLDNTLLADAVGSFHICPYVDCNGDGKFDFMTDDGTRIDREPFIMMNLVLVRVQGVSNDSVGQSANCTPFPAAGQTAANFGGFTTSSAGGGAWTGANSGWHADATVDVIGGGDDGLRGLNQVFGGWIQHIFLNGIQSVYRLPAPPAPPPPAPPPPAPAPRSHQYAFISNLPDNVHYGQYHYIGAAEAALAPADAAVCITAVPLIDAHVILDVSPFGGEGTGGDSAVGTNGFQGGTTGTHGGGYPAPTARPLGQRWQREMWDAPAIGCRRTHISAGGTLASFRFNLGFRTDLCFWTNTDAKPDPTANGPANRLYVSVYKCTWTPDFEIQFDPVTGVGNITIAKAISVTKEKSTGGGFFAFLTTGRAVPVDGFGLETRSPFALAWYAVDART